MMQAHGPFGSCLGSGRALLRFRENARRQSRQEHLPPGFPTKSVTKPISWLWAIGAFAWSARPPVVAFLPLFAIFLERHDGFLRAVKDKETLTSDHR
jgi:hypothetical protein